MTLPPLAMNPPPEAMNPPAAAVAAAVPKDRPSSSSSSEEESALRGVEVSEWYESYEAAEEANACASRDADDCPSQRLEVRPELWPTLQVASVSHPAAAAAAAASAANDEPLRVPASDGDGANDAGE